jgi:uncharacterized protein
MVYHTGDGFHAVPLYFLTGTENTMKHSRNVIRTYTGLYMDPFEMKPEQVRIEDIAHSLSMTVRANGHLSHFFSVAQHCVNCALEAKAQGLSRRVQLACLLHDAAECYISDIPRPVKHRLIGYAEVDRRVSDTVYEAFGLAELTEDETDHINSIDDAMLYYEFEALTGTFISDMPPYAAMRHDFSEKRIEEVEREFLELFNSLLSV